MGWQVSEKSGYWREPELAFLEGIVCQEVWDILRCGQEVGTGRIDVLGVFPAGVSLALGRMVMPAVAILAAALGLYKLECCFGKSGFFRFQCASGTEDHLVAMVMMGQNRMHQHHQAGKGKEKDGGFAFHTDPGVSKEQSTRLKRAIRLQRRCRQGPDRFRFPFLKTVNNWLIVFFISCHVLKHFFLLSYNRELFAPT